MLRERSRHYLAMHVILGGGILGISVAIVGLLVNFTDVFDPLSDWVIFNHAQVGVSLKNITINFFSVLTKILMSRLHSFTHHTSQLTDA